MIFVLYQDKSHDDNIKYMQIYHELATDYAVHGASPLQWFTIDTLEYPDMEDTRVERAIHTEYLELKSKETGSPIGSYVYVMYEGHYQALNFKYDPA